MTGLYTASQADIQFNSSSYLDCIPVLIDTV